MILRAQAALAVVVFGERHLRHLDLFELAIVVAVFVLAGVVKGVIGLGHIRSPRPCVWQTLL